MLYRSYTQIFFRPPLPRVATGATRLLRFRRGCFQARLCGTLQRQLMLVPRLVLQNRRWNRRIYIHDLDLNGIYIIDMKYRHRCREY